MSYKVSIIIEKDDFGYYAYSPELEGCQMLAAVKRVPKPAMMESEGERVFF